MYDDLDTKMAYRANRAHLESMEPKMDFKLTQPYPQANFIVKSVDFRNFSLF
jgi:hypothetical protein